MRINKFISEAGICSRRAADAMIGEGRVTVNGQRAELGTKVETGDDVRVDGTPVGAAKKHVYIILNKPVGIECTTAQDVPDNIVDFVNYPERIFPVGRLDKASEGLILLTNHGDIVNKILRYENAHEKEYVVSLKREITDDFIRDMSRGVPVLGTVTKPCEVRRVSRCVFNIVLTQGLNRQIRRMCEHFGHEVTRLQRVRIMNLRLGKLKPGQWRELNPREVQALLPRETQDGDSR